MSDRIHCHHILSISHTQGYPPTVFCIVTMLAYYHSKFLKQPSSVVLKWMRHLKIWILKGSCKQTVSGMGTVEKRLVFF